MGGVSLTESDGAISESSLIDGDTERNTDLIGTSISLTNLQTALVYLGCDVASLQQSF